MASTVPAIAPILYSWKMLVNRAVAAFGALNWCISPCRLCYGCGKATGEPCNKSNKSRGISHFNPQIWWGLIIGLVLAKPLWSV